MHCLFSTDHLIRSLKSTRFTENLPVSKYQGGEASGSQARKWMNRAEVHPDKVLGVGLEGLSTFLEGLWSPWDYLESQFVPRKMGTSIILVPVCMGVMSHFLRYFGGSRYGIARKCRPSYSSCTERHASQVDTSFWSGRGPQSAHTDVASQVHTAFSGIWRRIEPAFELSSFAKPCPVTRSRPICDELMSCNPIGETSDYN